jgi:hypothetical protein
MKKSRILLGVGTFVLAVAAVFATKANKKFGTTIHTVYFSGTGKGVFVTYSAASGFSLLTTVNNSPFNNLKTAYGALYTSTGNIKYSGTLVTGLFGHTLYHL